MMDECLHLLGIHLELLRLDLPAIDDGRDQPCRAKSFGARSSPQGPGERFQCYRFHLRACDWLPITTNQVRTPSACAPTLKFEKRSNRRITVDSFNGFAQQPRN